MHMLHEGGEKQAVTNHTSIFLQGGITRLITILSNLQEELYKMNNDSELIAAQNCVEEDLIEGPELEQVQQAVGVCKDIIRNIINSTFGVG
jgi:hypothetical protein